MEEQTPALPAPTESLDYEVMSQSAPSSYHPVINFNESLPAEQSSDIKTARFYHSKMRPQQQIYTPTTTSSHQNSMFGTNEQAVEPSYSFENEQEKTSAQRSGFLPPSVQTAPPAAFKVPAAGSKPGQPYKYHQYQKISPAPPPPPPPQYNRIQQNYDLAVSPQHVVLPEAANQGMIKNAIRSSSLPSVDKDELFAMPKVS